MLTQLCQHWQSKCNPKDFLSSCTKQARKFDAITVNFFLLQLSFACNPAFYFNMGKIYKHIYHSSPHVSVFTGNILITIIRFALSDLWLASNINFMTDEPRYYLTSTKYTIFQIEVNCSLSLLLNLFPFCLEHLNHIYYNSINLPY